jgi:hypothetical protein
MDFKFLVNSIGKIFHNPVNAWEEIYSDNKAVSFIRRRLLLPLIILAAISAFLGSLLFTRTELLKAFSVLTGIKYFILIYLVIYLTALILRVITNTMGLVMDFGLSFKLIAYSSLPFLLCQIVSRLFESFVFVNVLALFGLYIFWTGMEKLLSPPEKKKIPLLIAATLTFIAVFIAADWLLSMLFDKLYFAFFAQISG